MDTIMSSYALQQLVANLIVGSMTDFEIRTGGHVFRIHRVIAASTSIYFQRVCTGAFKEAAQGFIEVEHDAQTMTGLILGLYTGHYLNESDDHMDTTAIGHILFKNAYVAGETLDPEPYRLPSRPAYEVHALMYAAADYYHVVPLASRAITGFKEAINAPDFGTNELMITIQLLYNTHVTYDDTLRALVVYMAQRTHLHLSTLVEFDELLTTIPIFALDFATKYNRANWIWCPQCERKVVLKECKCGFSGVCGYKLCTEQNFAQMTCTSCGRKGHMMKEQPKSVETKVEKSMSELVEEETKGDLATSSKKRKRN